MPRAVDALEMPHEAHPVTPDGRNRRTAPHGIKRLARLLGAGVKAGPAQHLLVTDATSVPSGSRDLMPSQKELHLLIALTAKTHRITSFHSMAGFSVTCRVLQHAASELSPLWPPHGLACCKASFTYLAAGLEPQANRGALCSMDRNCLGPNHSSLDNSLYGFASMRPEPNGTNTWRHRAPYLLGI